MLTAGDAAGRSPGRLSLTAVWLLAASVAIRVLLLRDLPALLTDDSWDFLRAAVDIRQRADFFSIGLRDVRLPGYPVFLALTSPLSEFRSDAIVVAQKMLGTLCAVVGLLLGWTLGSRAVQIILTGFFGLNPVFLLSEHAIMSETLALLLAVLLVSLGVVLLERSSGWRLQVALGLLLGLCLLTRANFMALGAVLALGLALKPGNVRPAADRCRGVRRRWRSRPDWAALVIMGAAAGAAIAPWIWRNKMAYGRPALHVFWNRNALVYMSMHYPLDTSAPTISRVNRMLADDQVSFSWLGKLGGHLPPVEAEATAAEIIREQIMWHPGRHLCAIGDGAVSFLGFDRTYGDERSSLLWWFRELIPDVARMRQRAIDAFHGRTLERFRYEPRSRDGPAGGMLAVVGGAFLRPGRSVMIVAAALILSFYLGVRRRSMQGVSPARFVTILTLTAGFLASVGIHAVMLTDNDRYASAFDFVVVVIVALMIDDLARPASRPCHATTPGADDA